MTVRARDFIDLETEVATLFVDNPSATDIKFIQSLVKLVTFQPRILEIASEIPAETRNSFVLLLLERVFLYTLTYQHSSYGPYHPKTQEEARFIDKILRIHFSSLRDPLNTVFKSLGAQAPIVETNPTKSTGTGKKTSKPKEKNGAAPAKKFVKYHIPIHEDPGIHEEPLQFFWVPSATEKFDFPEELKTSYPNWAKGVISSMQRSLKLFQGLKKGKQLSILTAGETRVQPHHRMIRILLGTEFYWLFNKREVDLGRSIPNKRITELVQGFLFSLYDLFISLFPPDHPIHQELSYDLRTNWRFERVRGIRGASKVLSAYEDNHAEYLIECTGLSINLKKHVVKHLMHHGQKVEKGDDELLSRKPLPLVEHPDPGVDEDILWRLYTFRRSSKKGEEETWPEPFYEKYPLWSRGIVMNMTASLTLYHEFKRSRYRTKSFDTAQLQPHHLMIRILIAAEYFWLFNMREVTLPDSLGKVQAQELMITHMYDVAEEFRKLLPLEHVGIKDLPREQTEDWRCERIRGAGGAPRVIFKIKLGLKEYLVQCTASVIALKLLTSDELLIEIEKGPGVDGKNYVDETEENPLPISEYEDPGIDEHILWMLYTKKVKNPGGWSEGFTDHFPTWARGIVNSLESCRTLFSEIRCNKRRYKRFEGHRLQPNHDLIKFLIAAEYYWLYNFREVQVPREIGLQEVKEMHQTFMWDVHNEFIELLPEKHPVRQIKRKDRENWKAERIRGSSGASKVIVRLIMPEKEYLLEMTSSVITVKKLHGQEEDGGR